MYARIAALLVCALLYVANLGFAADIAGKVVGVHDGDTITLLTPGNIKLKVRLEGIDAPELKQDFGNASKQELSRLVFGKQVRIEERGKDRYGRTLGNIFLGPEWVNESMVKSGMAWVYLKYSKDPKLLGAEALAKRLQRGLWKDKAPVPPWDWRGAKKVSSSGAR